MSLSDVGELFGAAAAFFGGGSVVAIGLLHWYGDYWSKRILKNTEFRHKAEIEKLKADLSDTLAIAQAARSATQQVINANLEHRVYVSKAQFDVEFETYREIWNKVTYLRWRSAELWPSLFKTLHDGALSESELEEFDTKSNEFDKMYKELMEFVFSRNPFMSASINEATTFIAGLVRYPVVCALESARGTDSMVAEERKAELVAIQEGCNGKVSELGALIRDRLAEVSIIS